MRVLGLSFSGHGSSICLVEDGRIACAVNLERLTRVKFSIAALRETRDALAAVYKEYGHDQAPPIFDFYDVFPQMLEYVTGEREIAKAGIDLVVKIHDNIGPSKVPEEQRAYEAFLRYFAGISTHFDLEHHLCHAYQAYLCSPFEETAILTIDGNGGELARLGGDAISTTLAVGRNRRVEVFHEVLLPSSVGGFYATITKHIGFREEQEGNTMALAAFGKDLFYGEIQDTVRLHGSGSFELLVNPDASAFISLNRLRQYCPKRNHGEPLTEVHKDIAWCCQFVAEAVLVNAARGLAARTGLRSLAMAGGVALNCVANAKVLNETPFEKLYVMPNAGDRGLAVGAALYGYHVLLDRPERHPPAHDYLGRTYGEAEILAALSSLPGIEYRRSPDIAADCAKAIASGRILGWVQGGAEFGPRALGHRSILGDPRTLTTKERLDREIKRREWFRPYAPSVLAEEAGRYFDMHGPSPYMLQAVRALPLAYEQVPGVVHVDGSVRVQTVERSIEPLYHRLISAFSDHAGVPVVLNTSFNGYGEPIVETPADALKSMLAMRLDAVAIGDYLAWRAGDAGPGSQK